MEQVNEGFCKTKKRNKPTVREFTTALLTLRALQIGLRIDELDDLNVGELMDLITESANDNYEYPLKASQNDIDAFTNGG